MKLRPNELTHSFFNIVNIEEKLYFTWQMTELRNVSFKILLDLLRQIAKPQAAHLVIPFNDRALIFLGRILTDPVIDFSSVAPVATNSLNFIASKPVNLQK